MSDNATTPQSTDAAGTADTQATDTSTPNQEAGKPTTSWIDDLPEDLKVTAQAKGWKSPVDVAKAYQGASKFLGTDPSNILRLPKGDEDLEGWNKAYDSLGRPKDPGGYELTLPETASPEDKATADWYKDVAHKAGLSVKQAKTLFEAAGVRAQEMSQGYQESNESKRNSQAESLAKEWGQDFDRNVMIARKAAADVLGDAITAEQLDTLDSVMGHDWTMKLMHRIGSKLGEAPFITGKGEGPSTPWLSSTTAQQKLAEINEKYKDELSGRKPFPNKLKMEVLSQREELYKVIYGGQEQ